MAFSPEYLKRMKFCTNVDTSAGKIINGTSFPHQHTTGTRFPCIFDDAANAIDSSSLEQSVFIATHMERAVYVQTDCVTTQACNPLANPPLIPVGQPAGSFEILYHSSIGFGTIAFEHSISVPAAGVTAASMTSNGRLVDCNGKVMHSVKWPLTKHLDANGALVGFKEGEIPVDYKGRRDGESRSKYFVRMALPLDAFLAAACVTLDSYSDASEPANQQTYRETGAVFIVSVEWTNLKSWLGDPYEWTVKVKNMPQQKYKIRQWTSEGIPASSVTSLLTGERPFPGNETPTKEFRDVHGVLLILSVGGEAGYFVVSAFFQELAGALAMLALARAVTDILARFVLRDRAVYGAAIIQETNDIDGIHCGLPLFISHEHDIHRNQHLRLRRHKHAASGVADESRRRRANPPRPEDESVAAQYEFVTKMGTLPTPTPIGTTEAIAALSSFIGSAWAGTVSPGAAGSPLMPLPSTESQTPVVRRGPSGPPIGYGHSLAGTNSPPPGRRSASSGDGRDGDGAPAGVSSPTALQSARGGLRGAGGLSMRSAGGEVGTASNRHVRVCVDGEVVEVGKARRAKDEARGTGRRSVAAASRLCDGSAVFCESESESESAGSAGSGTSGGSGVELGAGSREWGTPRRPGVEAADDEWRHVDTREGGSSGSDRLGSLRAGSYDEPQYGGGVEPESGSPSLPRSRGGAPADRAAPGGYGSPSGSPRGTVPVAAISPPDALQRRVGRIATLRSLS